MNIWKNWRSSARLKGLFSGWEVKEKIARPVVVNLTTALLIFLAALPFKATIQSFFSPARAITTYPLFCVMEPYNEDKKVTVDLFVINQTDDPLNDLKLLEFVEQHSSDKDNIVSHKLVVRMKRGLPSKIVRVVNDADYNENGNKGEATVEQKGDQDWVISIKEIKKRAMIRLKIFTDDDRTITSKSAHDSLPVELFYAGKR